MEPMITEQNRPTHEMVELAPRTTEGVRQVYFIGMLAAGGIWTAAMLHDTPSTYGIKGLLMGFAFQAVAISFVRIVDRPRTANSLANLRSYIGFLSNAGNVVGAVAAACCGVLALSAQAAARAPDGMAWLLGCVAALAHVIRMLQTAEQLQVMRDKAVGQGSALEIHREG